MPDDLGALAPKYRRVAAELRQQIEDGVYAQGDKLPAETTLAARYRVSLPTLRQAMNVLRAEGVVESRHGVGTFVREKRRLPRRLRCPHEGLALTQLEQLGPRPLPQHIVALLGTDAHVTVRRHVFAEPTTGRVEGIGASYLLDDSGTPAQAQDHWLARLPSAEEAAVLVLPPGSPVLHVIHFAHSEDGTLLEISESVWPADRIMLIDSYPTD